MISGKTFELKSEREKERERERERDRFNIDSKTIRQLKSLIKMLPVPKKKINQTPLRSLITAATLILLCRNFKRSVIEL